MYQTAQVFYDKNYKKKLTAVSVHFYLRKQSIVLPLSAK